jgi:hypothetical protein
MKRGRVRKRKFGSWKNANRHSNILRRSEAACDCSEVSCGELVANLRRSGPDVLEAVVTHLRNSCCVGSPRLFASSAGWAAIDGGEIGPRGRNHSVKHTMSALPLKATLIGGHPMSALCQ